MREFKCAKDNPKLANLMEAIIRLCKQNGVSLSHEDSHGGFIFEEYKERNADWLRDACDETEPEDPFTVREEE